MELIHASLMKPSIETTSAIPILLPEPLLEGGQEDSAGFLTEDLRAWFKVEGALLMYVGNLEQYQGIDLLVESFAQVLHTAPTAHLVAIGGSADNIQKYQAQVCQYQAGSNIHFIGPRPVANLKQYLEQADIVVSPRIQGNNTPMKLYSYLDSGKALLATNLTTHTQVLNSQIAQLVEPTVHAFTQGILHLINHPDLRGKLGAAAQAYISRAHTYEAFSAKLNALYDWLDSELPAAS